jgi:hypothetical protein
MASSIELKDFMLRRYRYANGLTPYRLEDPIDSIVEGRIDDDVTDLLSLFEKMALDLIGSPEVGDPDKIDHTTERRFTDDQMKRFGRNEYRTGMLRRLQELLGREK